jgi:hypothetical protein
MALSMKSPIVMDDIDSIEVIRPGTVYVLTGLGQEKLVLKSEAGNLTASSFKTTKAAMKQVDTVAATAKLISDPEKAGLKMFAERMKSVIAFMTEHRIPGYSSPVGVDDILANFAQNPHALWYKMPLQNLADLGGALKARVTGSNDKNALKEFADALKGKGGLEALGKIIACDMFIGNQDRFNPTEGSSMTYGTRTFDFHVIKNVGNVFIAGPGSSRSVTGMDFVDPSTGYRNYESTLSEVANDYNEGWLGDYLVDRRARKAFAKLVIEDLEMVLSPNRKSYSPFTKLGLNAATRLERGMVTGSQQILAGLTQKYKAKPAPAGMQSRLAELAKVTG